MQNATSTSIKQSFAKKDGFLTRLSSLPAAFWICIFLLLVTAARIWLGNHAGLFFYNYASVDDALYFKYASGDILNPESATALIKTRAFSLFLKWSGASPLNYLQTMNLVWICTAGYLGLLFRKITKKNWIGIFVYTYILFFPTAFEVTTGMRLYRNVLIAPTVLLFFGICVSLLYKAATLKTGALRFFLTSLCCGAVFTFSYYIKEDGAWLLLCLIAILLLAAIFLLIRLFDKKQKKKRKQIVLCLCSLVVPLAMYGITNRIYLHINEELTGVAEIETRTSGAFGEFASLIYDIDSDERSMLVWAPEDALEKAFEASPTLASLEGLKEAVWTGPRVLGDLSSHAIRGDGLNWLMMDALLSTGNWTSQEQVESTFTRINNELKEAFENGTLKKEDRFALVSMTGGYTLEEIFSLRHLMATILKNAVFLSAYTGEITYFDVLTSLWSTPSYATKPDSSVLETAVEFTGIEAFNDISKAGDLVTSPAAKTAISLIFTVYRILNPILLLLSFVSLLRFVQCRKSLHEDWVVPSLFAAGTVLFWLLTLVYTFALAWFSPFLLPSITDNGAVMVFYTPAVPALLFFVYICSVSLLSLLPKSSRAHKKHPKKKVPKTEKIKKPKKVKSVKPAEANAETAQPSFLEQYQLLDDGK
jgi:hypothetical protein